MNKYKLLTFFGLALLALAFGINSVLASPDPAPERQASALHPNFALLDSNGVNVLENNNAISTLQTCGQCHDTNFIASHAFHSDLGLSDYNTSNSTFDTSTGTFGQWNPLTYRYLSKAGDERLDLSTAEWLLLNGERVVGSGPATTSRNGELLTDLNATRDNPETSILNGNGSITTWDWAKSGTMEMNCFLCHLESPDTAARADAIIAGEFGNANTASLFGLDIVNRTAEGWEYNNAAFNEIGEIYSENLEIQDPTNSNCAACHGEIHTDTQLTLLYNVCDLNYPQTATTGQVISPQRINESGVNLAGKNDLDRSWDIHAERQLQCTDCHYATNNPAHVLEAQGANPEHLIYDPRTLDIGEYLERPDHNFARGESAQFNVAPKLKGTMRRCGSCHDSSKGHSDWLPYVEKHMAAVACETCHIPQMYAPAIQTYDWTVITTNGTAIESCRGVDGARNAVTSLVTGYEPVLLNRSNIDGQQLLAPYNLITSFYWVYEDANGNKRPVRLIDLESTFLDKGAYASDIVTAFDANRDGKLSNDELVIDSPAKEEAVKTKLSAIGLNNPRIEGLVQPYSINHNVTQGKDAVNDCKACHNAGSRLDQSIKLADHAPVMPVFDENNNVQGSGEIIRAEDGALYYQPIPANDKVYVFGSDRVSWIDWLGMAMFIGTILGVSVHSGLRYLAAKRRPKPAMQTKHIYMYEAYERFWHWLQALGITILLLTGMAIHRPDLFSILSFPVMVTTHTVIAALLVFNFLLSLFWHVVSGEIQQYVPHPYGFFDQAIAQAKYYIVGIFNHERHPFEKTKERKFNPLQKITYFGLLAVLLPLQGVTGILIWGTERWPAFSEVLNGLTILAPIHTLTAWLLGAFVIGHVYLTTTAGPTPLDPIAAMITGWEDMEVHEEDEKK